MTCRFRKLGIVLFWICIVCLGIPHVGSTADLPALKSQFLNPPREFSTGPLWVWNDNLTEAQIRSTLRDLAAQSVKQVWVHPRPGLMTPYLSEDWFRLWKVALKEAERLDMNVWIYDENSYPSGFAGGLVPETMPQSRGRGLTFQELTNGPVKWTDSIIGLYQLQSNHCQNVTDRLKNAENLGTGRFLLVSEARAGNDPWHGNRCYVNLLSPGVTEKFLDITMEAYRAQIGAQFGKRVPGVFTDEPNIHPAGSLPWSETLLSEFKKRWSYDLLEHLPSLTRQVGDWKKIRHNYFALLNEQFIEHWSRPYHDYCASNHLEWTGHYWDHDWPHCIGVPDNMAMYAWHQRPAIDCLMNQYREETHAQFGNARMVKELSSVANQLGMKRTLCEVYGAGGWDLRFEDMKRIGDWLEVLGVNTLNQHLSYITIRGARKRDHPQSFSYHEPWWEAYHGSAQYLARLSLALSQGQQINPLLVIEPTTTAWMYQGDEGQLSVVGNSFFNLIMKLESAQVEYDLGCEDILARHGSVGFDGLQIGQRAYKVVLLPEHVENLDFKTAQLLSAFVQQGGTVLCCGDSPKRIDGALAPVAAASSPNWKKTEPGSVLKLLPAPGVAITRAANDRGILFHHLRQLPDAQFLFLANTSAEQSAAGSIECSMAGIEQWDLHTGKIAPYPFQLVPKGLKASFHLPPSGSLMLRLSSKPMRPAPPSSESISVIQATGDPIVRRLEPNVLTLDFTDVTAGGETKTNVYFYEANKFAWKKNGIERDPWDSAVQFKNELISKKFSAASGFSASYRFRINGAVPKNLQAVVERPDLYSITCNGQPLRPKSKAWWLDKSFGRIDLSKCAKIGENVLTITASPFTMYHELEPAYLLGDFSLKSATNGFVIGESKPLTLSLTQKDSLTNSISSTGLRRGWISQGLPFYGAGIEYTEAFEVKKPDCRFIIHLPDWYGSVAKITVNGKLAGFIDAPPSECDVTSQIRRGQNRISVTVIGTLKNTLGPHHGGPPLGAAWPSAFHKAPVSGPPPGDSYSVVAYGLFEPFILKQVITQNRGQRVTKRGFSEEHCHFSEFSRWSGTCSKERVWL